MSNKGWIGVDFDGTLAHYDGWVGADHCGRPIEPMLKQLKLWLSQGREVRIFTARIFPLWNVPTGSDPALCPVLPGMALAPERLAESAIAARAIQAWCRVHVGCDLPITCVKDYGMVELWDDRAVQVKPNTGLSYERHREVTFAPVGVRCETPEQAKAIALGMETVLEALATQSDLYIRSPVTILQEHDLEANAPLFTVNCRVAVRDKLYDEPRKISALSQPHYESKS